MNKLLTYEVNDRPSSKDAFAEAFLYYNTYYSKFTSIISTLECFLSLPTIGPYFIGEQPLELINKNEKNYLIYKLFQK